MLGPINGETQYRIQVSFVFGLCTVSARRASVVSQVPLVPVFIAALALNGVEDIPVHACGSCSEWAKQCRASEIDDCPHSFGSGRAELHYPAWLLQAAPSSECDAMT